ncbi:diguanylate cyclase [Actinoplanes sp. GCM10030250]|uniref:diguanylate cyclase n=1 Tax=Actinoplanes sp. GCM10030250 TaxID=3273376 RepID=UPI00361F5E29
MDEQSTATPAERDAALAAALVEHPGAMIGATTALGLFVPLPEELAAIGLRPIQGGESALTLVVAEDHTTVAQAWIVQRTDGWSSCTVRPLADPEREIGLHFIDTTHRLGVVTVLISGLAQLSAGAPAYEQPRPRLVTMVKDQVAKVLEADPAINLVLGWEAAELLGNSTLELVHPDDRGRAVKSWMDLLASPVGSARRVRLRHLHRDGEVIWFEITNHNRLEGDRPHVLAEMLDISDEMAAQEALRASEQLLSRLAETLPMGVVQVDGTGRMVYRNTRYSRAVGGTDDGHITEMLDLVVPADRGMVENALTAVLSTGKDTDIEYGYRNALLGLRRISVGMRALTGDTGDVTGAIICFTDVTEEVRLREQLRQQATYDTLTGCHNRAATLEALEDRASAGRGVAVLFLDLNEFKQVNDRLGHHAGDQLLVHVAGRLRAAVRHDDVVGRLGGDEFVVICRDVPDAEHARKIGETLVQSLESGGIEVAGEWLRPAASIGAAWSRGLPDPEALVARADAAMYTAKKARTGRMALVMAD